MQHISWRISFDQQILRKWQGSNNRLSVVESWHSCRKCFRKRLLSVLDGSEWIQWRMLKGGMLSLERQIKKRRPLGDAGHVLVFGNHAADVFMDIPVFRVSLCMRLMHHTLNNFDLPLSIMPGSMMKVLSWNLALWESGSRHYWSWLETAIREG